MAAANMTSSSTDRSAKSYSFLLPQVPRSSAAAKLPRPEAGTYMHHEVTRAAFDSRSNEEVETAQLLPTVAQRIMPPEALSGPTPAILGLHNAKAY